MDCVPYHLVLEFATCPQLNLSRSYYKSPSVNYFTLCVNNIQLLVMESQQNLPSSLRDAKDLILKAYDEANRLASTMSFF
jgi:hypothetical protein